MIDTIVPPTDFGRDYSNAGAIMSSLNEASFGIICITSDNFNSPGLNYEAGLMTNLSSIKVHTFSPHSYSIPQPFSNFDNLELQHATMLKLVNAINIKQRELGEPAWPDDILQHHFDYLFPILETDLSEKAPTLAHTEAEKKRIPEDLLEQILVTVKEINDKDLSQPAINTGDYHPETMTHDDYFEDDQAIEKAKRILQSYISENNLDKNDALQNQFLFKNLLHERLGGSWQNGRIQEMIESIYR